MRVKIFYTAAALLLLASLHPARAGQPAISGFSGSEPAIRGFGGNNHYTPVVPANPYGQPGGAPTAPINQQDFQQQHHDQHDEHDHHNQPEPEFHSSNSH